MTLRAASGRSTAENIDDLAEWLMALRGGPGVNRTVVAHCPQPSHGEEPATWFYVEADAAEGVARLRCLGCGHAHPVLDSDEHWTYPPVWACHTCAQSIAEVVHGMHVENGADVIWLAVGVRCVNCGDLSGVTDMVVPPTPVDDFTASL